MLMLDYKNSHK